MKKMQLYLRILLLIVCFCSLLSQQSFSQESFVLHGHKWIKYHPPNRGDGCHKEIKLQYRFDRYMGVEAIFWSIESQNLQSFTYKGRIFSLVELGFPVEKEEINTVRIEVDLNHLTKGKLIRLRSLPITALYKDDTYKIMSDYYVIEDILKEKNVSDDMGNLSLSNFELVECGCGERKELEESAQTIINKEIYKLKMEHGERALNREDYQEALDRFGEAYVVGKADSKAEAKMKIASDLLKKQLEDEDLEELEKEEKESKDDFWDNGGEADISENPSKKDDFWNNGGTNKSSTSISTTDGSDFWDNVSHTNSEKLNHKIDSKLDQNGKTKYGVVDTNGVILIPFKFDHIFSFEDGLAKVAIAYKSDSKDYFYVNDLSFSYNHVGRVSLNGEWLSTPKKICYYWYPQMTGGIYLVTSTSEESRRKRDEAKEEEIVERNEFLKRVKASFNGTLIKTAYGYD